MLIFDIVSKKLENFERKYIGQRGLIDARRLSLKFEKEDGQHFSRLGVFSFN